MKHPDQTAIVYNKIKADSGLNESGLAIIGITKEKIDAAVHHFIKAGLSHKGAIRATYKLWQDAQEDNITSPTPKEMTMMGFYLTPQHTWKHHDVLDAELTAEFVNSRTFQEIEQYILDKKKNETRTK